MWWKIQNQWPKNPSCLILDPNFSFKSILPSFIGDIWMFRLKSWLEPNYEGKFKISYQNISSSVFSMKSMWACLKGKISMLWSKIRSQIWWEIQNNSLINPFFDTLFDFLNIVKFASFEGWNRVSNRSWIVNLMRNSKSAIQG